MFLTRRLRLPFAACAALFLSLVWLVPTANLSTIGLATPRSSSGPGQSPPAADPQPDPTPTCKPGLPGVRPGTDRGETLKDYGPNEILCAKGGDDTVIVRFPGTKVWAGPGSDTINTRQPDPQIANEIEAGQGSDRATVDRWDSWKGVESVRSMGAAERPSDPFARKYPAYQPTIQCRIVNGERRLLFQPAPQLRAVNRTSRVDWQSVAWSPVLTFWDPQTRDWELAVQNKWVWDRTYDEQIDAFSGHIWRRFTTSKESHFWFSANYVRAYYRIAVYYHHYAAGGVPANTTYSWVDRYEGDHAAADGSSCFFQQ